MSITSAYFFHSKGVAHALKIASNQLPLLHTGNRSIGSAASVKNEDEKMVNMRKMLDSSCLFRTDHEYDPWHIVRSLKKKLNNAAKSTDREDIEKWIRSVCTHFWWAVETCN